MPRKYPNSARNTRNLEVRAETPALVTTSGPEEAVEYADY